MRRAFEVADETDSLGTHRWYEAGKGQRRHLGNSQINWGLTVITVFFGALFIGLRVCQTVLSG